jgi:hypothetical protein
MGLQPQVAVAYLRLHIDGSKVNTHVFVLDKRAGKLIWYDDTVAANLGSLAPDAEPDILISPCKRLD